VNNSEGRIIKDVVDHIYDNIDEITDDYNTSVVMTGEDTAVKDGDFVRYGPYQVSENALLNDVDFQLTIESDDRLMIFVDRSGMEITQVKPGEPFYVRVPNDVSGEVEFTATATKTKELWYVNDFQFFIDVRDHAFPYMYQPLFRPVTNPDEWTYFYSCSGNFTITEPDPDPDPDPDPEPEKITLTCLSWNNGKGCNSGGINQFKVDGVTLKNSKNYVTPASFNARVAKKPGKNDPTAIYTVTERTVTDRKGKYVKVYDIKVAFYKDGIWKGYGGTITVDNPGGNNKNQRVDLIRIF
jgi:hypothetical protein